MHVGKKQELVVRFVGLVVTATTCRLAHRRVLLNSDCSPARTVQNVAAF